MIEYLITGDAIWLVASAIILIIENYPL